MRNFRFPISDQFSADQIAKDLQVQLEINRFKHVNVLAADNRNEVIVQVLKPMKD